MPIDNTAKGKAKMPVTEKRKEWLKENTVFIGIRLQKRTDAKILKYLDGKQNQTVIKAALYEYIANHPDD